MLFGYLIGQIILANLARDYGVSGIHLDRDRLVIDVPRYEGVTENGLRYSVVAETASAQVSRADLIALGMVSLEINRPDGVRFTATSGEALYDLVGGTVEVKGVAEVFDSRDTRALLTDTLIDWTKQTVTARGGADIEFADGTRLTAETLTMYGNDSRWDMTGVVLDTTQTEPSQ